MKTTLLRLSTAALLLVSVTLATGCDSTGTGEETITLNPNSGLSPMVHTLSYSESDYSNGQVIASASAQTSLASKLQGLDYSLSDVQSAQITGVTLTRQSSEANAKRKVFPYLSRAEVYLGRSEGPLVASLEPVPAPDFIEPVEMELADRPVDVTSAVKSGVTDASLRLQLDDPSRIGGDSGTSDTVELEITYSVTVPLN